MDTKKLFFLLLFLGGGGALVWAFTRKKEVNVTGNQSENSGVKHSDFSQKVENAINQPQTQVVLNFEEITTQLHKEMAKANTNPQVVIALLNAVTASELEKIIALFGSKKYSPITKTNKVDAMFNNLSSYTLKDWLQSELSPQEYQALKEKFPNQL